MGFSIRNRQIRAGGAVRWWPFVTLPGGAWAVGCSPCFACRCMGRRCDILAAGLCQVPFASRGSRRTGSVGFGVPGGALMSCMRGACDGVPVVQSLEWRVSFRCHSEPGLPVLHWVWDVVLGDSHGTGSFRRFRALRDALGGGSLLRVGRVADISLGRPVEV